MSKDRADIALAAPDRPIERVVTSHHGPSVITYPFPLRDGVLASIQLPADLTRKESKRLAAFIESLAVDDVPALPAARPTAE